MYTDTKPSVHRPDRAIAASNPVMLASGRMYGAIIVITSAVDNRVMLLLRTTIVSDITM